MRTIIFQSYRKHDVAPWITACMQSVQAWAQHHGFDYRFYDDSLFTRAPDWFRQKVAHQICPVTDLARLVVAKELLAEGYERAVWVDADLLVFDAPALLLPLQRDFMLCREVWVYADAAGAKKVSVRVNNAIAAFARQNVHLDFFIDAALRIAGSRPKVGKLDIGTQFYSQLRAILPFALFNNVGMLSPAMLSEIALGQPQRLVDYAQHLPVPLACANLCASLQGQTIQGVVADGAMYALAVQQLMASRGEVINRHRPALPAAPPLHRAGDPA